MSLHSHWTSKQKLSGETSNQRARPCAALRLYISKTALRNTNIRNVLRIPRTRGKFVTRIVVFRKAVLTRKMVPHVIYICCSVSLLGKLCCCEFSHFVVIPVFMIVLSECALLSGYIYI